MLEARDQKGSIPLLAPHHINKAVHTFRWDSWRNNEVLYQFKADHKAPLYVLYYALYMLLKLQSNCQKKKIQRIQLHVSLENIRAVSLPYVPYVRSQGVTSHSQGSWTLSDGKRSGFFREHLLMYWRFYMKLNSLPQYE